MASLKLALMVTPGHDLGKKFANVFKASPASGNIRVIKFRDDGEPFA